jgi:hypothetical protein
MKRQNIHVVAWGGLGDALLLTPALKAFKAANRNARIIVRSSELRRGNVTDPTFGRTAGPSTPLRFGRDDNSSAPLTNSLRQSTSWSEHLEIFLHNPYIDHLTLDPRILPKVASHFD